MTTSHPQNDPLIEFRKKHIDQFKRREAFVAAVEQLVPRLAFIKPSSRGISRNIGSSAAGDYAAEYAWRRGFSSKVTGGALNDHVIVADYLIDTYGYEPDVALSDEEKAIVDTTYTLIYG